MGSVCVSHNYGEVKSAVLGLCYCHDNQWPRTVRMHSS